MVDIIAAIIIIAVVCCSSYYIYRQKKKGAKCIGCPVQGTCQKKKMS